MQLQFVYRIPIKLMWDELSKTKIKTVTLHFLKLLISQNIHWFIATSTLLNYVLKTITKGFQLQFSKIIFSINTIPHSKPRFVQSWLLIKNLDVNFN